MDAYARLAAGRHHDPFEFLGQHPLPGGGWTLRVWAPGRRALRLVDGPALEETRPGLFEVALPERLDPARARLRHEGVDGSRWEAVTPYVFQPVLGELDLHLIGEGRHLRLWEALGSRVREIEGVRGVHFAVWAPGAERVSVVGDFNVWDGRRTPCRCLGSSGIWEIFVPGLEPGERYKFEILGKDGGLRLKADPLARRGELRPGTASVVADDAPFDWSDGGWMADRAAADPLARPLSIYELHPGSWKRPWDERPFLSWGELADELLPWLQENGFTHVELMPVMEHPLDASWGYQVTGYYAPSARQGAPADFRSFVNRLHVAGIGVILDWVPAHFPKDGHALARFDGSPLYEHADPRQGEQPDWGTLIFNFGRNEVKNFLLANALYWIDEFHADGLRIDAVASMLYLDYSRKAGEWVPNAHGGRENLEAIGFLRELNTVLFDRHPGVLSIAEESTSWPMVSRPVHLGGLGFNLKWNMGWMNDTLRYFELDPVHRRWHHDLLSFSLVYAWHENFVLVLSHDEVVHGKRSLLEKMPGDDWQKFANLRLLFGWMWCHPGRKLLFQGGELAQRAEWNAEADVDWRAREHASHEGVRRLVADLNRLLAEQPALWERDLVPEGFEWINVHDAEHSVFSFLRKSSRPGETLLVAANFTPVPRLGYRVGVPEGGVWDELLNTDAAVYGGSNLGCGGAAQAEPAAWDGRPSSLRLAIPPLGLVVLRRRP